MDEVWRLTINFGSLNPYGDPFWHLDGFVLIRWKPSSVLATWMSNRLLSEHSHRTAFLHAEPILFLSDHRLTAPKQNLSLLNFDFHRDRHHQHNHSHCHHHQQHNHHHHHHHHHNHHLQHNVTGGCFRDDLGLAVFIIVWGWLVKSFSLSNLSPTLHSPASCV